LQLKIRLFTIISDDCELPVHTENELEAGIVWPYLKHSCRVVDLVTVSLNKTEKCYSKSIIRMT